MTTLLEAKNHDRGTLIVCRADKSTINKEQECGEQAARCFEYAKFYDLTIKSVMRIEAGDGSEDYAPWNNLLAYLRENNVEGVLISNLIPIFNTNREYVWFMQAINELGASLLVVDDVDSQNYPASLMLAMQQLLVEHSRDLRLRHRKEDLIRQSYQEK